MAKKQIPPPTAPSSAAPTTQTAPQRHTTQHQQPSPSSSHQPHHQRTLQRSPSPHPSPAKLILPAPKTIHLANISYPLSFLRTPLPHLPFPHPKWQVRPRTGEVYEATSPIVEEVDGDVVESVEGEMWGEYVEVEVEIDERGEEWGVSRKREFAEREEEVVKEEGRKRTRRAPSDKKD